MKLLTKKHIQLVFKPREKTSHKGKNGHVLLIAGASGKMGAAVIAASACLRSGCGLLTVSVPQSERCILQIARPEAMLVFRENKIENTSIYSSIGIGPGLGTDNDSKKILIPILQSKQPLVLDADALNIIAANPKLFSQIPPQSILTPHPKEFDRLFGEHTTVEERRKKAIQKATELNIVIVLKDHQTLITTQQQSFYNTTGNAGLAKGGSGDALTGMISAFLAQGYSAFESAQLGVYLHGLAADLALKNQSMESLLITDVINCLGKAFKTLLK